MFYEVALETGRDIYRLSLDDSREVTPLVRTAAIESDGSLSPDGRWLAYRSNESGAFEIYVRPYPHVDDGRWQVSDGGGTEPLWAHNGRELFYRNGTQMLRVQVELEPTFAHGAAEVLFEGRYELFLCRNYDIAPDDQRFLMVKDAHTDAEASRLTELVLIQNWTEELKARVPTN